MTCPWCCGHRPGHPGWPDQELVRPAGRDSSQACRASFPLGRCRPSSMTDEGGVIVSVSADTGLVVGVDTHLDTHTAALCDRWGRELDRVQVSADPGGYAAVLAWARDAAAGGGLRWAMEGTRHYGLGLARHLASAGEQVEEIDAGRHLSKRRAGKSDAIDAVRAARELLARPDPAQMRSDGDREALRLLMIDRDNAIQSCKTARTAMAAVLVTAPAPWCARLRPLPRQRRARECAARTCPPA